MILKKIKKKPNYIIIHSSIQKAVKIKESKLSVFFDKNPEIYDILKVYNFEDPDEIPQPKYLISPVNIIVLDDLMATGAFTN